MPSSDQITDKMPSHFLVFDVFMLPTCKNGSATTPCPAPANGSGEWLTEAIWSMKFHTTAQISRSNEQWA